MDDKRSLLDKITPKAVLKATTSEAKRCIGNSCLDEDIIGIWNFPFRVGRESRFVLVNGEQVVAERLKLSDDSRPNNDLYLLDGGEKLQISREHFQIEKDDQGYTITDRQSACGTIINEQAVGGHDEGGKTRLNDGDIIQIGTKDSLYQFEFIAF